MLGVVILQQLEAHWLENTAKRISIFLQDERKTDYKVGTRRSGFIHITGGEARENVDASLNGSLSIACVPLENEMFSVKNKELALMRMQTFNALLNVLQKDTTERRSIMGVMNHSMDICKQIMGLQKSNRQLEEQLDNTRKSRIEIRMKQQELFQKLKYSEKTSHKIRVMEAKKQDKGRETLQSDTHKIIIVQEIFQRLILSSRVNWAENPYLKNLILKMGDPSLS